MNYEKNEVSDSLTINILANYLIEINLSEFLKVRSPLTHSFSYFLFLFISFIVSVQ